MEIEAYFASSPYSSFAAGLLCAMNAIDSSRISLDAHEERILWRQSAILPTRASCIFALARLAQEKGYKTRVVVGDTNYAFPDYRFYRYSKVDVDLAAEIATQHLQEAQEANVPIEEKDFTLADVREELLKGNLVLLRVNVKGLRDLKRNSSNYVLVHGYSKEMYQVFDPLFAGHSVSEEILQEAFESLQEKKHRDARMLILEQN